MTQKVIYRIAGADEVWLVWGINGWQSIPEEARPSGTVLKQNVMYTRMLRTGETYETTVRVPPKNHP
jgi:predicted carbohydrate-binding protein with starch-binding CBM53